VSAEGLSGAAPTAATATLPVSTGWTTNQWLLVLIGLALVALVLIPGVVVRRMDRHKR
jgi:LPXTG-motif cell wall-anchored protein